MGVGGRRRIRKERKSEKKETQRLYYGRRLKKWRGRERGYTEIQEIRYKDCKG